jgi:DNA (cytosine-5)-methyltransferase 1
VLREGSLFSGYNGLGLALELLGLDVEPQWFCDPDPGAAALLAHRYPGVPNLGDITDTDWATVAPVDILTGGFPCQDISNAGKREGITGARSSLWKHYVRAIGVLRPRLVFVENVAVLRARGLDVVLTDLAQLGFDAEWCTLPASGVGAPHRRQRLFLIAADTARERLDWAGHIGPGRRSESADRRGPATAHTQGDGRDERGPELPGQFGGTGAADGGIWAGYTPAVRRWESVLGRLAPAPTVVGKRGGRVLSPYLTEWMMGLPDGWITGVPGLTRNQQIKLAGNGVVPHQAAAGFAHLLDRFGGLGVQSST